MFQNDLKKKKNIYNGHVCNLRCYKTNVNTSKKSCKYRFLQPLINETHFNIEMILLHIKRTYTWLNNANQWILSVSKHNRDLKFTTTFGKENRSLIYYITYYITKISIYTSHIFFFANCSIKIKTINENPNNNYDSIHKSQHFLIWWLKYNR